MACSIRTKLTFAKVKLKVILNEFGPFQIMVTNVTSLLKTVKAVEDEHTRGTRALESSIEAIAQEIRAFDSSESPRSQFYKTFCVRNLRMFAIFVPGKPYHPSLKFTSKAGAYL